jgi:pimeloyl-ACP methyl ester carboxylesterase
MSLIARIAVFGCLLFALPTLVAADPIEDAFAARGPFETYVDFFAGPSGDFSLFRPAQPGRGGVKHPVITWGNGTLAVPLFYFGFLDHLASHGFVVIASNSPFTGSGKEMIQGVDWVLAQNADPTSPLYGSIAVDAIGAAGHSQGGAGTINAGSDPRIACTAPIEPAPGKVSELEGPMFVVAGGNDFIVPPSFVKRTVYAPAKVPTIFGILSGATHFDPLGDGDGFRGYVTAWFAACLAGNDLARRAFLGKCSLCRNSEWTVRRKRGIRTTAGS